ncbi:hypothetical protein INT45_000918 [Circinella minor]|uniref:Endonuclease/exonuclease/phosphatase domain-containing protein n=1 Tax=Circinella minor TaxID=1195481 RepID=A0A8H7VIU5_9FUNG|nr:hypothetical protein INT45_000918 [Circinella minor]
MIYSDITITLWNANGLTRQEIYPIINLFSDSIFFFTETWLLPPQRYATDWIQHHTYGLPTSNNNHGQMGITLLINQKCPYPVYILPPSSPYILSCQLADLVIHCVYLPSYHTFPDSQAIEFINNISLHHTNSSTTNTIICDDFNACNPRLTGDHHSNSRGIAMHNWTTENRLLCWNAELAFDQYIFFDKHQNGREDKSIIDLFFSAHHPTTSHRHHSLSPPSPILYQNTNQVTSSSPHHSYLLTASTIHVEYSISVNLQLIKSTKDISSNLPSIDPPSITNFNKF